MILDEIHLRHPGVRGASLGYRAFSLAEIVLALGILSVAIVGILGLLNVAATTSRDSDLDTLMVSMTSQVTSDLKSAPFDALWLAKPKEYRNLVGSPAMPPGDPEASVYYFTADGVLLPQDIPAPGALYQCSVKKMPDAATMGHGQTGHNLMKLHLRFQWPVDAPEGNRNAKSIYTTIARY